MALSSAWVAGRLPGGGRAVMMTVRNWRMGSCCDNDGNYIFYDSKLGEIPMSPTSKVLRNFMGDLMYMEQDMFYKYYDVLGE
jgi:hypothetical protein